MQRVKWRMPTLLEFRSLEENAAFCRALELDFVELNSNLPQFQPHNLKADALLKLQQKYGVFFTVHLEENLDAGDFNPHVAGAYRQTVADTIALAKEAKLPLLNIHLARGVYFTLPDRKVYLYEEYESEYLDKLFLFREQCEKLIGESGVKICVENSSGDLPFQKKALDLLLQSPVFALTFDVGHSICSGGADEQVVLQQVDKLCHMHLHDAAGGSDHLTLGTGELSLEKYLTLAQTRCRRVVIETKTAQALRQSVRWLRAKNRAKGR